MWSLKMVVVFFVVASLAIMSTMGNDEKECADQLENLASCIPFVSGTAKKPAPECCQDTQKLKVTKPKCLCVLIKLSSNPSLGLPVNTTLALQMPSACNIDAKVSDCPRILNLSPDSPDAKIFKEADQGSTTTSTSSPPATESASSSSSTGTSLEASPSSNSGDKVKVFLVGNCFVFAWIFM